MSLKGMFYAPPLWRSTGRQDRTSQKAFKYVGLQEREVNDTFSGTMSVITIENGNVDMNVA